MTRRNAYRRNPEDGPNPLYTSDRDFPAEDVPRVDAGWFSGKGKGWKSVGLAAARSAVERLDGARLVKYSQKQATGRSRTMYAYGTDAENKKVQNPSFPKAGPVVDGRVVRDHVPNLSSIEGTLSDPVEMSGIRKVSMASFTLDEEGLATDRRTKELAEEIRQSGEINPLIVGVDKLGPWIIEGAHRYDALKLLRAKSFPAVVVHEADLDLKVSNPKRTTKRSSRKSNPIQPGWTIGKHRRDGVGQCRNPFGKKMKPEKLAAYRQAQRERREDTVKRLRDRIARARNDDERELYQEMLDETLKRNAKLSNPYVGDIATAPWYVIHEDGRIEKRAYQDEQSARRAASKLGPDVFVVQGTKAELESKIKQAYDRIGNPKTKYWTLTVAPFQQLTKFGVFEDAEQAKEMARQLNRYDPNYRGRGVKAVRSDEDGFPTAWAKQGLKRGNPTKPRVVDHYKAGFKLAEKAKGSPRFLYWDFADWWRAQGDRVADKRDEKYERERQSPSSEFRSGAWDSWHDSTTKYIVAPWTGTGRYNISDSVDGVLYDGESKAAVVAYEWNYGEGKPYREHGYVTARVDKQYKTLNPRRGSRRRGNPLPKRQRWPSARLAEAIRRVEETGRTIHVYPRKRQVSISGGRSMGEAEALKKLERLVLLIHTQGLSRNNPEPIEWQAVGGTKRVIGKSSGKLVIETPRSRKSGFGHELIDPSELESEITFDTKQLASNRKQLGRSAELKRQEDAATELRDDTQGFAEQLSPPLRRRAISALNMNVRSGGKIVSRKQLILDRVGQGWRVEGNRFVSGDGAFLLQKDITKTGMDFARYLSGRRNNPEPAAAEMFEKFHGAPSTKVTEHRTTVHEHNYLGALGDLISMKIRTPSKVSATLNFPQKKTEVITLAANESGNQMYFVGGDQEVPLDALQLTSKKWKRDHMVLGELREITYRTKKKMHNFKLIDYYHKAGEDSGIKPVVIYDLRSKLLSVAGGQYDIRPEGIVN